MGLAVARVHLSDFQIRAKLCLCGSARVDKWRLWFATQMSCEEAEASGRM